MVDNHKCKNSLKNLKYLPDRSDELLNLLYDEYLYRKNCQYDTCLKILIDEIVKNNTEFSLSHGISSYKRIEKVESNDELILASFAVMLSMVSLIITFPSLTHPKSSITAIFTKVILSVIILYFFCECCKKIKQWYTKRSVKLAISIFLLEQALIKKTYLIFHIFESKILGTQNKKRMSA